MQTGKVKFYNETKGFGFIIDEATGKEVFVHATGLTGEKIKQDNIVSFETKEGKKGLNAINVKIIG